MHVRPALPLPLAVHALALALCAWLAACGDDDATTPPADAAPGADAGGRVDGGADAGDHDGAVPVTDGGPLADAGSLGVDAGPADFDAGPPRDPSMLCMQSCERIASCAGTGVSPACVTGCAADAADCSNPQQDALAACLAEECTTYVACIAAVGCIMSAGP